MYRSLQQHGSSALFVIESCALPSMLILHKPLGLAIFHTHTHTHCSLPRRNRRGMQCQKLRCTSTMHSLSLPLSLLQYQLEFLNDSDIYEQPSLPTARQTLQNTKELEPTIMIFFSSSLLIKPFWWPRLQ